MPLEKTAAVGPQSVAEVVGILQARYPSLLAQAVSLFTPFSQYISLDQLDLPRQTVEFIKSYEPRAAITGLFVHQWRILEAYRRGAKNFIMTSAAGSGKSLCFWAWVIDQLLRDPRATALVCFPTQALMWGQADRLAQISVPASRRIYDQALGLAYSGALAFGTRSIGWTIWKGTGWGETVDAQMKQHEQTYDFLRSRIRIATLDKVHYSLIQGYPDFTKNLACLVLDEAHQYDGIFGANVGQLLKRLYAARESIGLPPPQVFMASATLAAAQSFAAKLTCLPERAFCHETDATSPEIEALSLPDAQKLLAAGRSGGLLRVAVFNDSLAGSLDCMDILSQDKLIGSQLNVLYFSDSKFHSRFLKRDIDRVVGKKRLTMIYDADLPPLKRREIEAKFNQSRIRGVTLIATNALELGVDLANLDLCVLDTLPPKRAALLQRLGRVGRRPDRPGLVLLNLSAAPQDRYVAVNPGAAFETAEIQPTPIPGNLDILRLKSIITLENEMWDFAGGEPIGRYTPNWHEYEAVLEKYFGERLKSPEAKRQLIGRYGLLVDDTDRSWTYRGFRASASQAKVPLRCSRRRSDVAWIEDVNLFRDAHPEAVYLDDQGCRWRVVAYGSRKRFRAENDSDRTDVLMKYLKGIGVIYVEEERAPVVTRGCWLDSFSPVQIMTPPADLDRPGSGQLEYGIYEYSREFKGYRQLNLQTRKEEYVSLDKVTERFRDAVNQGEDFPFLLPLTYRTFGWSWSFEAGTAPGQTWLAETEATELAEVVKTVLSRFIADAVEANPVNLQIDFSGLPGCLRVLDATPGGNGLADCLLSDGRMQRAFDHCQSVLTELAPPEQQERYARYIRQLSPMERVGTAAEALAFIRMLKSCWAGELLNK
jgi:superfamily II DNA/RNA helicase